MAHYAFLDENNVVTDVIVGCDETDGTDWEEKYSQIKGQRCKRTSYNTCQGVHKTGSTPFRKNYAGIGYTYSDLLDAFIPPKPFESWILDVSTCTWAPPIPMPSSGLYYWNEEVQQWQD